MSDKRIYRRRAENRRALLRQLDTSDFPARMRNQLALELGEGESVIDDEAVLIRRGERLGKRAAGSALPQLGVAVATNRRIRFAAVDDAFVVDVRIEGVRLTHDEGGQLTMVWSGPSGKQAVTLAFAGARTGLLRQIRRLVLEANKPVPSGPATPRVTAWDRLARKRRD